MKTTKQLRTNRISILFSLTALLLFPFISKAQITVDVNGNAGVGITNPGTKLEVAGVIRTNSGTPLEFTSIGAGTYNRTVLYHDATNGFVIDRARTTDAIGGTITDFQITQRGGGTPALMVKGSGNVGIGTTSPIWKLNIQASSGALPTSGVTNSDFVNGSVGSGAYITTGATSGNTYSIIQAFKTGNSLAADLSINPAGGNVGIGTTSPNDKLDVAGNVNLNAGTNAFKINGNKVLWYNNNTTNIFTGVGAGTNTTGSDNSFMGYNAGNANTTGGTNSAFGDYALYVNTTASNNTACGSAALKNTSGNSNTAIGYGAGLSNSTGTNNTLVGYATNVSTGALTNATAIGNGATVTASNNMWFGNANVVGWGFGVAPGAAAIKVGTSTSNGNGAYLTTGGAWTNGSSRTFKDNITPLDGKDILKKIALLEIARWKYKETNEYHIGPFAEEFYELFNTGIDNMHISTIDPSGVALAGIKQLIKQNEKMEQMVVELDSAINAQNSKIADLQNQISNCCAASERIINNGNDANSIGNVNGKGINDILSNTTAILYQNVPNPFNQQTSIQYFIPTNAQSASIMVFDLNGKLMNTVPVTAFGKGAITINGSALNPGMFVYSLVVDEKIIDTKRMILIH